MAPLGRLLGFTLGWIFGAAVTLGFGLALGPIYWLLAIRGADRRAVAALEKLKSTLMGHEAIVESAIQHKVCALSSRRLLFAITNSRMILVERPILGGFTMKDYQWKDLVDVQRSENVLPRYFGSSINLRVGDQSTGQRTTILIDGIDGVVAAKIYAYAQSQEQAWEEKRRVRGLEESRAAAGGVILGGPASNANGALAELERAKNLFDVGAVSDAEYQELKAKILGRVG